MTAEERSALLELERDVAVLARHLALREAGHATPAEYERLREIADRYPRNP
jgi:hypothetical protein